MKAIFTIFLYFALLPSTYGQIDSVILKGRVVTSFDSSALKNTKIKLMYTDKKIITVLTDKNGRYVFSVSKCDCEVILINETSKETTNGKITGWFLGSKDMFKFNLKDKKVFVKNFILNKVVQ